MIKKNTKIIFDDGRESKADNLIGGIPLSKGETIHIHKNNRECINYEVTNKIIDYYFNNKDQIINITYALKRIWRKKKWKKK